MTSPPANAAAAIAVALLPMPAMKLLDLLNRGCGDGLCGFASGLLVLGGLAAATLFFVARSARHGETPSLLRLVPFVIWISVLVLMIG